MSTTTFAAIRSQIETVLAALTPATASQLRFKRAPRRVPLRDWVTKNTGDGAVRRWEMLRGDQREPMSMDASERVVEIDAVLTVAYPTLIGIYGANELDSLEDVIEADANQIRDALYSSGNYVAGCYCVTVSIMGPDRTMDGCYLQPFQLTFTLNRSQSLT